MAKIASEAAEKLKATIDAITSDPQGPPGVVCAAVNRNGQRIFEHASGKMGAGIDKPMTADNVFWIASCTKVITGIACMQLVEQGKLSLDDSDQVKLAPELKAVQVLDNGRLVPKKKSITLRMLLTHTAGFGYTFFSQSLNEWAGAIGLDEFSGSYHDYLSQPLIHQPGERWEYGINIDWAGQLVERVSGLKLNDYFHQHIFKPLGLSHISMFPTDEMKQALAYMNVKSVDGAYGLNRDGHLYRRPLTASSKEDINSTFHAGGAGLFSTPGDFLEVVATLLNDGLHPGTGNRILKKETVEAMFTNQIPDMPNFARQGINSTKPWLVNPIPEIYPEPPDVPQGWGLTFFLHLKDGMLHSAGTGWWSGLPNLYWWVDRKRGLGGIVFSQIIPSGDLNIAGVWVQFEAAMLQNLE
ncbi:hypothetical protein CLAIMM_12057 [Cladophialophora immunda]|nr:hypothetical protein CLAIMM_12057 [Cladophialophora immunda]